MNKLKGKKIIATVTNPLFHDKRMIRICNVLREEGAEVCLVGVERKETPKPAHQKFKQELLKMYFQSGPLFYLEYNLRLFIFLVQNRFDLLISVDLDSLLAGSLASSLKGKRKIYDAHEYFTKVPELLHSPLKRMIWECIARIGIGKFNMTVSSSLAKIFKSKYKREFVVIRNLPDKIMKPVESRSISDKKDFQLVYLGYLNEGRGLEEVLIAMTLLPKKFRLKLVGGGDILEKIESRIQDLKLQERVEITGWVEPDEFEKHLSDADLGLNLLVDNSESYYYSLANKTFEYMHRGIPSLQMNFPEYLELENEFNCFYFLRKLDPNVMAEKIKSIFSDFETFSDKSNSNLKAATQLNWSTEQKKFLYFIFDIIDQ